MKIYKNNKTNTVAELHFHTKETSSCGMVSALDSVPRYKEAGYDLIVVTDHLNRFHFYDYYFNGMSWEQALENWLAGYRAACKAGEECGIKVLLGAEIKFDTNNNDYLVYGITEELLRNNPLLWELGEEAFSRFAKENGLFFAQAHPYRDTMVRCDPSLLDGVEIHNAHPHHNSRNELAVKFCKENDLIPLCGQDFHDSDALRGYATIFHTSINNTKELVEKLKARDYELYFPEN